MSVGYSGTPLPRKLGIKPHHRLLVLGAPKGFELGELPEGVSVSAKVSPQSYDVVLLFCPDVATLAGQFAPLMGQLEPNSALWVGWLKKASKISTDLTEDFVRTHGLACGLVDVKICAINEQWSGLKFVYRLADRPTVSKSQA